MIAQPANDVCIVDDNDRNTSRGRTTRHLKIRKIRIAVPENFPPFGSLGEEGEYVGYDVEIARMIADDLGVELELVTVTSKQRIPFLETDRVDLVVSVMGANPERAKSIWFSSAYAPFYSGAFAKPDVELDSVKGFLKKGWSDWWNAGRFGNQRKCSCRR